MVILPLEEIGDNVPSIWVSGECTKRSTTFKWKSYHYSLHWIWFFVICHETFCWKLLLPVDLGFPSFLVNFRVLCLRTPKVQLFGRLIQIFFHPILIFGWENYFGFNLDLYWSLRMVSKLQVQFLLWWPLIYRLRIFRIQIKRETEDFRKN